MKYNPFVPDGYTETQSINSLDKKWPDDEYQVTFRPPVSWETDEVVADVKAGPAFLVSKIKNWNLKDQSENILPITEANIRSLRTAFYVRLLAVVCGWGIESKEITFQDKRNDDIKN